MKPYRSPKTEVREGSKIEGKGLFAREFIRKGEIVAIKGGYILTLKEFNDLTDELKQKCLQIEDDFFIGPKTKEEIENNTIFINHSCEPNVGFDGQITYVAIKDIRPGEELCHDYAMCFTRYWRLKCNCRQKNCRKTVTADDWKIKELQNKYGDRFAYFILKKIWAQK